MPSKPNPMLRVLQEIRDEIRETNARLEKVDGRVGNLERRQTETEVRLATELVAVAKAVGEVRDLLRDRLDDHGRVDDHERRIAELERRTGS